MIVFDLACNIIMLAVTALVVLIVAILIIGEEEK